MESIKKKKKRGLEVLERAEWILMEKIKKIPKYHVTVREMGLVFLFDTGTYVMSQHLPWRQG